MVAESKTGLFETVPERPGQGGALSAPGTTCTGALSLLVGTARGNIP